MQTTNTNQNPDQLQDATEGHVFKMKNFILFMLWTIILRYARGGERVCDFGCGDGSLLELEYRNRTGISSYIGMDKNTVLIEANNVKWNQLSLWATFITADLTSGGNDHSTFLNIAADTVVAFNVPDNLTKVELLYFIENCFMCGNSEATYYIRLPRETDLFSEQDLEKFITTYFIVKNRFGTIGSTEKFKPLMNEWQFKMYEYLIQYYSDEFVAGFLAPFFPDQCQQNIWVLKRKVINQI
jgi:hypothetical protein